MTRRTKLVGLGCGLALSLFGTAWWITRPPFRFLDGAKFREILSGEYKTTGPLITFRYYESNRPFGDLAAEAALELEKSGWTQEIDPIYWRGFIELGWFFRQTESAFQVIHFAKGTTSLERETQAIYINAEEFGTGVSCISSTKITDHVFIFIERQTPH